MKRTKLAAVMLSGVMTLSLAAPAFAATYKVAAGDTLWHIAETQLGSGSKWSEIYEANKDSIKDPNLIFVGQEITIPGDETVTEPKTYTGTAKGMQGDVTVEMTVAAGKITKVEVTQSKETAFVTDVAMERIPAQIVEHQTTTLDTVTGATFTSSAILRAATNAAKEAGLDMNALKANAYHATAGADKTINTDVLVIGGGGAGFSAAISAAQNGAKVTLIEKSSYLGGNTFHAGGAFNAVDPEAQATRILGKSEMATLEKYAALSKDDPALHFDQFPEWAAVLDQLQADIKAFFAANEGKTVAVDMPGFDSIALHMWNIYEGGLREMADGTWTASNIELARILAENALDSYEWTGSLGMATKSRSGAPLSTVLGAMWQRTHTHPTKATRILDLKNAAEAENVAIYTEMGGTELLTDANGKVIGAKAVEADGTKVTINTTKGVVLACGGYCANAAMVKEYDEYWGDNLSATTLSTNAGTNTGDGIIMAKAIGAELVDMGVSQMMPSSSPLKGTMTDGIWADAAEQLWIGADGKRFVNEYAERDVLAKASMAQPDGIFYIIYAGSGMRSGTDTCKGTSYTAGGMGGTVKAMVEGGHIWYGSTLAELAEATKTPAGGATSSFTEEQLRTVIEQYNSYVVNQYDPDFGKGNLKGYIDLEYIESNPDVGICISPRKASLHHTMGGVKINTEAAVINTEGNVIEGLWAAGEVTGGIHAGNRLGGNAIADIFTFGRIAGRNAANATAPSAGIYTPGTYTGTGEGFGGTVTAEVTVSATAITSVKLTGEKETPAIGGAALPTLEANAVAKGADMDAVSGASVTSTAAKDAVTAALALAKK